MTALYKTLLWIYYREKLEPKENYRLLFVINLNMAVVLVLMQYLHLPIKEYLMQQSLLL